MAPFVHLRVDGERLYAAGVLGDDDLGAARVEIGDDGVAVEGLVSDQGVEGQSLDQRRNANRICCPRCGTATSSSWIISAATAAKSYASSFARPAPSCSCCRNTPPTSTRSSRCSPSSSTCCAKPPREPVDTVCAAIGELLGSFTTNECANYFKKLRLRTKLNALSFRPQWTRSRGRRQKCVCGRPTTFGDISRRGLSSKRANTQMTKEGPIAFFAEAALSARFSPPDQVASPVVAALSRAAK
jgi:hypothetical protein